ncbi:MAG: hypothetical protein AAFX01_09160 [Cyanobacteria bacterium J06638_28]
MERYSPELEQQMQRYYQSLSAKDRRRYAALEALKLGHGGMSYITNLFGCHAKPVRRGIAELQDEQAMSDERIRQPGGWPQKSLGHHRLFERSLLARYRASYRWVTDG